MRTSVQVRVLVAAGVLAGLLLHADVSPASAQQELGAVVCVGFETESRADGPMRFLLRHDMELVYRVGINLTTQSQFEVEESLSAELRSSQAECVWAPRLEDSHLVVVSFQAVVKEDLTIDPQDLRYHAYAVGFGRSSLEAQQAATAINERFLRSNDGSGFDVLVREAWGDSASESGEREVMGRHIASAPRPEAEDVATPNPSGPEPGTLFRDCDVCPEMVVVPPGSFVMGSPESEAGRRDNEGPQHEVTIGYPFAVGVYEVTFAEYDAGATIGWDRPSWGRGRRPVINVDWEEAQAYVAWLSEKTGEEYRLLSEMEWEYVARAGTHTARYWGESASEQCRYANADNERSFCDDGYQRSSAPVGMFEPNAFGLYDVLGNVWEVVEDCGGNESFAGAPTDGSPRTDGDCNRRVIRGGSWADAPVSLRSAMRLYPMMIGTAYPVDSNLWGFRVARTIN